MRSIILGIISVLGIIVPLLIGVAYVTLLERKVLGSMHLRKGPNVVGWYGLLQPLADGVKLFGKETIIPTHSNKIIFVGGPIIGFILAFISWGVIPYTSGGVLADMNVGLMYIFGISSISVYSILLSGWASNSKYAFIGGIRATAQMISYEVSIGIIILTVVIISNTLNLSGIVESQKEMWNIITLFPAFIMFMVSALAETNRAPFDLTEGESELVSGFNVEYSGMTFALFFLAEYSHIILMSGLTSILFLGGWLGPLGILSGAWWFGIKTGLLVYVFIWIRGTFPRMRYDQLMSLIWKSYLPLSLGYYILVCSWGLYIHG